MVKELLFGNRELVDRMINEHDEDFIVADSLDELADKMQEKQLYGIDIDKEGMKSDIRAYDDDHRPGRKVHVGPATDPNRPVSQIPWRPNAPV